MTTSIMGVRSRPRFVRQLADPNRPSMHIRKKERIRLSVLCNLHARQFRRVHCEVTERTILIRGTVRTYYEQQLAQELVRSHRIGWEIMNRIEVLEYTE